MFRSAKANNGIAILKRIENDKLVQQANEKQYARLRENINERAESGVFCVAYHKKHFNIPFPDDKITPEEAYFLLKNHSQYVRDLEQDGYTVEFNYQSDKEMFDNVVVSWGDA